MSQNNKVTLIGNLGGDVKVIEGEKLFAAFSMATQDSYIGEDNKRVNKDSVWHRIIIFSPVTVEKAKQFKKGDRVEVNGSLSYRPFEVKDGGEKPVKKQEATVIVHAIEARPL